MSTWMSYTQLRKRSTPWWPVHHAHVFLQYFLREFRGILDMCEVQMHPIRLKIQYMLSVRNPRFSKRISHLSLVQVILTFISRL